MAGDERWRTTTSYGGDRVHVDPPEGGIPTTTISDARGQTTALRRYGGPSPQGTYDETTYTYTPAGQRATLTEPSGIQRRWEYDQRGRTIKTFDPDAGTTESTYDDLDRLTTTKDARGQLLTYTYDKIGRKTAVYSGTATTGTKLAAWTYDSIAKGHLYAAIRYNNGKAYGVTFPNLDSFYRPLRTRYIIPAEAGAEELAGTYEFTTSYNRDGTVQGMGLPGVGGLPRRGGRLQLRRPPAPDLHDRLDVVRDRHVVRPDRGAAPTRAEHRGEEGLADLGVRGGHQASEAVQLDRQDAPVVDIDAHLDYDAAGNVLSIEDTPAGGPRDIQCFTRDSGRRLTEAWTTTSTASDPCAGGPAVTGVGGPAPYHHSYTYHANGGRDTETIHGLGGTADVNRDYTYPAVGQARPHSLSQMVEHTTGGDRLYAYGYDDAGNTTERNLVGTTQALTWDAEGHLANVATGGQNTTFLYDADGGRLIRKEPGSTTLYLGGTELRLDHTSRAVAGTRFYGFGGLSVAVRQPGGVKFLASDHQSTQGATVDATTGAITRRRSAPFGATRGADPGAFPGDKGFVGGTQDPTTGLTHLGAREYDPTIGRFISADPVFVPDDPSQFDAYQYGRHNPVTFSDPSGLRLPDEDMALLRSSGTSSSPSCTGYMAYTASCGYNPGGGGGTGTPPPAEDPQLAAARDAAEKAKQKLINAGKELAEDCHGRARHHGRARLPDQRQPGFLRRGGHRHRHQLHRGRRGQAGAQVRPALELEEGRRPRPEGLEQARRARRRDQGLVQEHQAGPAVE